MRDSVIMPALKEAESFSATTDLWTSAATEPYMTLTVHFIDKTWNLQSFCLDTVPIFSDHTGQNITDAVMDILTTGSCQQKIWWLLLLIVVVT